MEYLSDSSVYSTTDSDSDAERLEKLIEQDSRQIIIDQSVLLKDDRYHHSEKDKYSPSNTCIFATTPGEIGVAATGVQVGDWVCRFQCGRGKFLLRKMCGSM